MNKLYINTCGWVGVLLVLIAYTLNSFNVIAAQSGAYIALNIIGSAGIVINSGYKKDYQPAALNLIWMLIAVINLFKTF